MMRHYIVSNLSNLHVEIKASQDFIRLSAVMHIFTCCALWFIWYNWILLLSVISAGLFIHKRAVRSQKPYPEICALSFSARIWTIIFHGGECHLYSTMRICLDAGFFTLLHFSSPTHRRCMVIFHDQLSQDALKKLYVIAQIRK